MFGLGHVNMWDQCTLRRFILGRLPGAEIEMYSIVSWSKELLNWMSFKDPFASDNPPFAERVLASALESIYRELLGYKLVAIVRKEK